MYLTNQQKKITQQHSQTQINPSNNNIKTISNFNSIYQKAYNQLSKYTKKNKQYINTQRCYHNIRTVCSSHNQKDKIGSDQMPQYYIQKINIPVKQKTLNENNNNNYQSRQFNNYNNLYQSNNTDCKIYYKPSLSAEITTTAATLHNKQKRKSLINLSKPRYSKKNFLDFNINASGKLRIGSMANKRRQQNLLPSERIAIRQASKQIQRKNRESLNTLPVISQISSARKSSQQCLKDYQQRIRQRSTHYKNTPFVNLNKIKNKLVLKNPQAIKGWDEINQYEQNGMIQSINFLK